MKRRVFIWTAASSGALGATLHVANRRDYPEAHLAEGILDEHDIATIEYEDNPSEVQPITRLDRFVNAAQALGFHICLCDRS